MQGPKNVYVAVYVETPRRRVLPSTSEGNHRHLHQAHKHVGVGGNNNRREELLNYSRQLRDSAANSPANDHHHQNTPILVSSYTQQPISQVAQSNRKHAKHPACMGSLKLVIPSFIKSFTMSSQGMKRNDSSNNSIAEKDKTIMQHFQVNKNKGIFKKFLTAIQKYR